MQNDIIYSEYVRDLISSVLSEEDPNHKLDMIDPLDRDLFYVVKFLTIVWNGGIDAYMSGYCGDDLMNVETACENLNLIYLSNKIDVFLNLFPELKKINIMKLKLNHVDTYEKILRERCLERFEDVYEFEISDSINGDLKRSLQKLLYDNPEKLRQILSI